jgi:hypothetical protein
MVDTAILEKGVSRGGTVRIRVPASVAADITSFQKSLAGLAERLGCKPCISGRDCWFRIERDFLVNDKMEVVSRSSGIAEIDPDGSPMLPSSGLTGEPTVRVTLRGKAGFDLAAIQRITQTVAGKLGCAPCCSGFDVLFQQERNFLADEAGMVHGLAG